jgi:uncharacterized protein YaiI (UPF0178 family)
MTAIYIDADACRSAKPTAWRPPAAACLRRSNGSRPIRPPGLANVQRKHVGADPDAADDWIAERITEADVCVTADIPLAARCLAKAARRGAAYRQALDAGQHRQRPGWPRGRTSHA